MAKTTINPDAENEAIEEKASKKVKNSPEPAVQSDEDTVEAAPDQVMLNTLSSDKEDHETALVTADSNNLAIGQVESDLGSADQIRIPWINIAHGVGGLFNAGFTPGDIVLDKEHCLAKVEDPLYVIILKSKEYLKETLSNDEFKSGIRPKMFSTFDEARAAGYSTDWTNDERGNRVPPQVRPAANYMMLIRKPNDLDLPMHFNIVIDSHEWALAQFSVDKSAFNRVNKPLRSAIAFALKNAGLTRGLFKLWTQKEIIQSNGIIVPRLELDSVLEETYATEINGLFPSS